MNIDELTYGQIKEIQRLFVGEKKISNNTHHPMLGRRCLVRTYSAGVHIGDVAYINTENAMEIKLENALRLWQWKDGGLSLSAVANNGIVNGRLNRSGEVYLTNVIEMIPTTSKAEESYEKFIED
jgi:hypothetical protein